ncbi:3'-5' exonuclease isoform X2 [Silene latifolia]|uniref:3'-5' exonuclease isoform X2 n=1 Tax=Silene latifolia TaxID=37657 RepID=UPI003D772BC6
MKNPEQNTHQSTSTPTTLTSPKLDDWDTPFTNEELEAIDAAFEAAKSTSSSSSLRRTSSSADEARPKTRRRLPDSFASSNVELGSSRNPASFALTPCRTNSGFRQANVKLKYPPMNFGGRIVYCRTIEEVEEATLQILKLLEAKKCELGRAILGLDLEWKPSFDQGIPQGIAAVMQICGDMTHCYVLHIFHSGIPHSLQSLLEDSSSIKVGVGIDNDAVKLFHDYNVSIKAVQDLSTMANQKLGVAPKQWSLSSLVETLTCKQVLDWYLLL